MDALNPVTVTCHCKRCGREAATFENAWIQVGPYDFVPTKPAFYDVQFAGMKVQNSPLTKWEKSTWQDLLCIGCDQRLGIVCQSTLESHELKRGDVALRIPDLHTIFRDYRTANNGPGPDPKLNIVKFLDLYSSFPPKQTESSTDSKIRHSTIHQLPPIQQSPHPTTVAAPTSTSISDMNNDKAVEELKDAVWRIENELKTQRKDIDRVTGMMGRMETDMLVFRSFMADVRFELDSKATTANFQANLQQMGDGIWREINALRAQGHNSHPAQQNSDDIVKFTVEEVDALTDSISKINQKASEVDGLRMEFQFMKNRLKRLEDASRIPLQPATTSNDRQQSDAPPLNYPPPEEVSQKRPAEASDNSPNKRPRHIDESTVMSTYNIVHPPSGQNVVHPNSPHGQHLQQYTQQLNGGARPGHMNLGRAQPSPAPTAHTAPYIGPYHQPPPINHQQPPPRPYSPQRPPTQPGQGPPQPGQGPLRPGQGPPHSGQGLPHPGIHSMPQQSPLPPITSQPPYPQQTQSFPPQPLPPRSWSPRHYVPQPQAGKLKFTDPSTDQPRRPRGRPRKDRTIPGTPRSDSSPHPSTESASNTYSFPEHATPNPESQRPSITPTSTPPIAEGSSFNMSNVEKPAWLRDREPAVGSFQSGVFRPTQSTTAKTPVLDDNGVRLTRKGLPDGRIQNGKALGDWRTRCSTDPKSASSTPGVESTNPADQTYDTDEMRAADARRQTVRSAESNSAARESAGQLDRPSERESSVEIIIKREQPQ